MDRTHFILGLALLIGLVFVRLWDPYPIQAGRNFYFDSLQRIKPRAYLDVGVRVVDIDEASLRKLGQWPWPRDIIADLVTQLKPMAQRLSYLMFYLPKQTAIRRQTS